MRRVLRWLVPTLLAVGVIAGAMVAWSSEASAPDRRASGASAPVLTTPVLSVRRVPSVVAAPIAARRLRTDLDALVGFLPADSCLVVDGPDLRYEHRADASVVPASTQKLLTATAVLERLEPEGRFRTAVRAPVAPAGGVVGGDLVLVGSGDPLLATSDYVARYRRQPQIFTDLDTLAAAVVDAGVTRVEGAVVGDEQRYDQVRYVAGWPPRYIVQDVTGPLSALAVNDGFARYPSARGASSPLDPAAEPAQQAASVFTRLLEARGVEVVGAPRAGTAPAGGVEVAAIESVAVRDVVGQLLRESDNSTGELLLKELGHGSGSASTAGGASVVADVVAPLGTATVVDGSGLSTDNRVTCALLVDLLGRAGTGELIGGRLPVAGRSGTLTERFAGTPLEGILRAKTGSLTSVAALAGYVEDDDGPLAFALVVNTPPPAPVPDDVAALQQQIGEALASWPRVPDVDALGPQPVEGSSG